MIRTTKLSVAQHTILALLVKRGHAMTTRMLCDELRRKYISTLTLNALRDYGYIRLTDQGWIATDAGRLRAHVV